MMMLLFVLLIAVGIYYLYINNKEGAYFKQHKDNAAEETLRLRYVNGEIDDETYERMRKTIKK